MRERRTDILVAIDYTRESDAALDLAARLAGVSGTRLTAVHVIPAAPPQPAPSDIWESGETTTTKEQERLQQHVAARMSGSKLTAAVDVLWGDPAEQIADRARDEQASLIVLGCADGDGVPQALARRAPCPVVCVHLPGNDTEKQEGLAETGEPATAAARQTVADVMHAAPTTIGQNDVLATAQTAMARDEVHQLPVVDNDVLVGILSTRDLRAHEGYLDRTRVVAAMTQQPVTIAPQATVQQAIRILLEQNVNALPVVEEGRLVGILSRSDLLRLLDRALDSGGEAGA